MSILLKVGVDISRLNRNIRRTLPLINDFMSSHDRDLIITSTYEGNHSPGSLHYGNDAYDFRWELVADLYSELFVLINRKYPNRFDVVAEPDHIHIEYDPK